MPTAFFQQLLPIEKLPADCFPVNVNIDFFKEKYQPPILVALCRRHIMFYYFIFSRYLYIFVIFNPELVLMRKSIGERVLEFTFFIQLSI